MALCVHALHEGEIVALLHAKDGGIRGFRATHGPHRQSGSCADARSVPAADSGGAAQTIGNRDSCSR